LPVGNVYANIESAGSITIGINAVFPLGVPGKSAIVIMFLVEELNGVPVSNAHFDFEDSIAFARRLHHSLVATVFSCIGVALFSETTAFAWLPVVDKRVECFPIGNRVVWVDGVRSRLGGRSRLGSRSWGRVNRLGSGLGSWLGSWLWGRCWVNGLGSGLGSGGRSRVRSTVRLRGGLSVVICDNRRITVCDCDTSQFTMGD